MECSQGVMDGVQQKKRLGTTMGCDCDGLCVRNLDVPGSYVISSFLDLLWFLVGDYSIQP